MKRYHFALALFFPLATCVNGQVADGSYGYYRDAALFGSTSTLSGSTARIQAVGGAQVSLGGDLSVAGVNPAGLGFFNKSVASFSPGMNFHNTNSRFLGSPVGTYKNNFNFANLGVGFNSNIGDYSNEKFKGGTFAITLSRVNDFNNLITYQGRNNTNSIIDYFMEDAGTLSDDQLSNLTYSAYENYLINPVYDENDVLVGYDSFVVGSPRQTETIETSGGQYQWNFAWGGNYDDKIYFGAGLGIVSVDYTQKRIFREDDYLDGATQNPFLNSTEIQDKLTVEGTGINSTFGLIVRPVPVFTLGVTYTTPTFYSLSERSKFDHYTSWNNVELDNGEFLNDRTYISDLFITDYELRTPGKLGVGGTFFLGKFGFLTGDVEFIDYRSSQLKSSDFQVFADNQSIQNIYTNVVNYRLGTELRWEAFRFRGGYTYAFDPYAASTLDSDRSSISYGVGYFTKDYSVDLGVTNSSWSSLYTPYNMANGSEPIAEIDNSFTSVNVTVGFSF